VLCCAAQKARSSIIRLGSASRNEELAAGARVVEVPRPELLGGVAASKEEHAAMKLRSGEIVKCSRSARRE